MMRALVLAAVLSGCAEGHLRAATAIDVALIACDIGQTYYASNGGRWDRPGERPGTIQLEMNPLLGPTPSAGVLVFDLALATFITTLIGASPMPRWFRSGFLIGTGVVEGYVVATHVGTAGVCGVR